MSSYIGIDLGTTYSAVAYVDETGRPKIAKNNGVNITPSCVMVENDALIVGAKPESKLGWKGFEVGARFKRNMGEDNLVRLAANEYTPTDLSAAVLAEMKRVVESEVGSVADAVVTIPANFMQEARDATMVAAKKAGLKIKNIINEPTAAALYYGYLEGEDLNGYYVVYDLGGGTFDVSVVHVDGAEIEVVATEGVKKLGGDDFDRAIVEIVKSKYKEITGSHLVEDEIPLAQAVKMKHALSEKDVARHLANDELIEVSREEFEAAISSFIAQAELLCEAALEEAQIGLNDVKRVFLAGGSTRVPSVLESIERVFNQRPVASANVDEVVALGAALYAALKSDGAHLSAAQSASVKKLKVSEIATYNFGTLSMGYNTARGEEELQNTVIIPKGTKIPASRTHEFSTRHDNQEKVNCSVTKSGQAETDPRFVSIIWEGSMEVPGGRPKGQPIEVTYAFDENGMMKCNFLDVASGTSKDIELDHSKNETPKSNIDKFLVD